jgi:hypothetical protein
VRYPALPRAYALTKRLPVGVWRDFAGIGLGSLTKIYCAQKMLKNTRR